LAGSRVHGAHGGECRAPAEEAGPRPGRSLRRGRFGADFDRLKIIGLPQDKVDRVESGIAEAGRGGRSRPGPPGSTIENVAGCQVTVKQDDRGDVLREPVRESVPALVQLRRDQRRQLRVAFVELR